MEDHEEMYCPHLSNITHASLQTKKLVHRADFWHPEAQEIRMYGLNGLSVYLSSHNQQKAGGGRSSEAVIIYVIYWEILD